MTPEEEKPVQDDSRPQDSASEHEADAVPAPDPIERVNYAALLALLAGLALLLLVLWYELIAALFRR